MRWAVRTGHAWAVSDRSDLPRQRLQVAPAGPARRLRPIPVRILTGPGERRADGRRAGNGPEARGTGRKPGGRRESAGPSPAGN